MDCATKMRTNQGIGKTPLKPVTKKEQEDVKYSEKEKKAIADLKKLYMDTIKLDVELQRQIYNLEKSFEAKHSEIFDKRRKILDEYKKSHGDVAVGGGITHFWLKVLKASYTEFISARDEKILEHLVDVRSKLHNEPVVKFVLEFHFEPNDYFSNRVLTKSYFLNCNPDVDDPLTYDGAEIYKCEGCKIDWKNKESVQRENDSEAYANFFDFFNPPKLPENSDTENYSDINATLQNDFELGFYLKERVIPKAVLFFTGEIADCQSSTSESESDSEEDDDGNDSSESETPGTGHE